MNKRELIKELEKYDDDIDILIPIYIGRKTLSHIVDVHYCEMGKRAEICVENCYPIENECTSHKNYINHKNFIILLGND